MAQEETQDAQTKEALEYWGYLFKPNKCGTDLLNSLLAGIASFITTNFDPSDDPDLTPPQLAAFYHAVGGDYDPLFVDTPSASVAFIYKSLGCLHSIQPKADDDGYCAPSIPALKRKGFITWQTIQLLLGPEEHVPFLQNAVTKFDIKDPGTGQTFPKLLPKEAFPERPDPDMIQWYEGVSEKLKMEAEAEEQHPATNHHNPGPDRTSSEISNDDSADEGRAGAARYFRDPMYRNRPRPHVVRRFSRASPRDFLKDRGRTVSNTVRNYFPPWAKRRSLGDHHGEHHGEAGIYDDGPTPTATVPRYVPGVSPHHAAHRHRPRVYRRGSSLTNSDTESDGPKLRHRRSHEPAASPREYFPPPSAHARRVSSDARRTDPPGYGPSKAPIFATHVSQMQAPGYGDRRPALQMRESYSRPNAGRRYAVKPREEEPLKRHRSRDRYDHDSGRNSRRHSRSRESGREDRNRDLDRRQSHRYVTPVDGVGGRRYPVEAPWR